MPLGRHDGLKEVKANGHVCPQHMYYKPDIWIGAEDCLWLSVFTRDEAVQCCRETLFSDVKFQTIISGDVISAVCWGVRHTVKSS